MIKFVQEYFRKRSMFEKKFCFGINFQGGTNYITGKAHIEDQRISRLLIQEFDVYRVSFPYAFTLLLR